jgi:hypothetical protein
MQDTEQVHLFLPDGTIEAAKLAAIMTGKRSYRAVLRQLIVDAMQPYTEKVETMLEETYEQEQGSK